MNQPRKIIINGKEFASLDQIPEDLKKLLKDENQNGIPDIAEGKFSFGDIKNIYQFVTQNPGAIQIQGQTYSNFDELPPEAKQKVSQAMARFSPSRFSEAPSTRQSSSVWVFLMVAIGLILTLAIAGWFIFSYVSAK